jgi:hypothetical protein
VPTPWAVDPDAMLPEAGFGNCVSDFLKFGNIRIHLLYDAKKPSVLGFL